MATRCSGLGRRGLGGVVLLTLLTSAACGGQARESRVTGGNRGPHILVGSRGNVSMATLDVVNGSTAVEVSSTDLGNGDLYRVSTPTGSGIRPLASRQGRQTVLVGETGTAAGTGIPSIDVVLDRGVRWAIKLNGGANTETVDMGRGDLSALTFGAGVSTATVDLPRPNGTETVTLAGGASQLVIVAPPGPPAQVSALGGAGRVLLDGTDHTGVAGGSVFSDPGWAASRDRYAVDLTSGVSDFRMSRS